MNIRTILRSPKRAAAVVAVAGLLFAACGSGSSSERGDAASARRVATAPRSADVDTLWSWLAALPPADREQALVAFVPDVRGALQALLAGMVAPGVGH
jgi:hypothetical protein